MKGTVVALYAFDVAAEVRTERIGEIFGRKPFPFQLRAGPTAPKAVSISAPLTALLPEIDGEAKGLRLRLRPTVKIFDVGALSIAYEIPFEVDGLRDLLPYHVLAAAGIPLEAEAGRLATEVTRELREALVKPNPALPPVEAYTVFRIHSVGPDAEEWVRRNRTEVAALLNEEIDPGRLSERQLQETFRHALSYSKADQVVLDWDAALLVDPGPSADDLLYMLELANLQLEEYRILDDRLDLFVSKAYEDLERYAPLRSLMLAPDATLRRIRQMRMDITRMSEELSNITKFVGDWYLARVYLACKDRFHLGHWETSVDQKLLEIDRVYSMMHHEINERRMLILEAAIVALFVVDLFALFLLKTG
jgi:hypothetical protein